MKRRTLGTLSAGLLVVSLLAIGAPLLTRGQTAIAGSSVLNPEPANEQLDPIVRDPEAATEQLDPAVFALTSRVRHRLRLDDHDLASIGLSHAKALSVLTATRQWCVNNRRQLEGMQSMEAAVATDAAEANRRMNVGPASPELAQRLLDVHRAKAELRHEQDVLHASLLRELETLLDSQERGMWLFLRNPAGDVVAAGSPMSADLVANWEAMGRLATENRGRSYPDVLRASREILPVPSK